VDSSCYHAGRLKWLVRWLKCRMWVTTHTGIFRGCNCRRSIPLICIVTIATLTLTHIPAVSCKRTCCRSRKSRNRSAELYVVTAIWVPNDSTGAFVSTCFLFFVKSMSNSGMSMKEIANRIYTPGCVTVQSKVSVGEPLTETVKNVLKPCVI
jgi:hypothetical protein